MLSKPGISASSCLCEGRDSGFRDGSGAASVLGKKNVRAWIAPWVLILSKNTTCENLWCFNLFGTHRIHEEDSTIIYIHICDGWRSSCHGWRSVVRWAGRIIIICCHPMIIMCLNLLGLTIAQNWGMATTSFAELLFSHSKLTTIDGNVNPYSRYHACITL